MTGMKIRLTRIRNRISSKAKGATYGILLFLLAFAAPQINKAQDKPDTLKSLQASKPGAPPQTVVASIPTAASKRVSANKTTETLPAGAIMDVKITPEDNRAIVIVTTNQSMSPQETILDNPKRLVLDFPNTRNKIQLSRFPVGAASVKQLRVQQFQTSPSLIARMVFDLEEGSGMHELTVDKEQIRIVFHKGQPKLNETSGLTPKQSFRQAEPIVKSNTQQAPPSKPASIELKPRVVETLNVSVPAPPAAVQPRPATVVNVLRPRSVEPSIKETQAPPPLIAALAPTAIPAQKTVSSSNSRFSGQPLTLDLVNVPLVDFFRLMAEEGGINIVLDPAVNGTLSMKVVKLPWDQIFEAALTNNGLDKQVEGTMVRIAKKSTLQEEAKQQESLKKANLLAADLETRVKRLNYAKAEALVSAINDQKTVRGTIVVEKQSNSLILTDLPSAILKQIQLIEILDVAQPQVEIEARIVSASRNFARDIGVQFGFVQGNLQRVTVGGPNTYGTIGGSRPSSSPATKTYVAGNDTTGRGSPGGTSGTSGAVSTGDGGNYNVNLPASRAFGGMGISVGNIFDTFLLDAAITAGETKGMAKLISQPKVIAQNNSKAVVTQGLRFPVPINANNTVTIQFFDAALTLTATPQITYEGNIVLDLKVENNTADFGNSVDGVPSIRTSESSTRVLVTDGGTTVIGGILMEDESNSEDKVPGLGSLPLIGNLFKRTSVSRKTEEILFFVTPRIIK
jgi:type IV pilus secretin PilQ/predicted competence protein